MRSRLKPGDLVVFFCAKQTLQAWEYFYIGFGTIRTCLDRDQIWRDAAWDPYRRFYNILGRPGHDRLEQHETFYPYHPDWRNRLSAPYLIFEAEARSSHFNLINPLHIASYVPKDGISERWRSSQDPLVSQLERLLFIDVGLTRRLRTSWTGHAHPPVSLHTHLEQSQLHALREELVRVTIFLRVALQGSGMRSRSA